MDPGWVTVKELLPVASAAVWFLSAMAIVLKGKALVQAWAREWVESREGRESLKGEIREYVRGDEMREHLDTRFSRLDEKVDAILEKLEQYHEEARELRTRFEVHLASTEKQS